jgi:hypothetical protein
MLKPPFKPKVFDLLFLMEPQIRPCCGAIFFTRSLERWTGDNTTNNGSYGLVDTGKKKLLVTCQHVWSEFQAERRNDSELKLCVCLNAGSVIPFDSACLIDQDEKLDLACFDMEPFLDKCAESQFAILNPSHVRQLKVGDALGFIGCPGRVPASTSIGVQFRRVPHVSFVYGFNDRFFMADLSRMRPLGSEKEEEADRENPYGGISGSPCFFLHPRGLLPELVGFATSVSMSLLQFTRVQFLNEDGTIRRT